MISGTVTYKDKSSGGFSFKNWESLIKMSGEENLIKIRLFKPIKKLDCEIRIFEKEKENDGFYFSCEVGFCESMGERGFIYTFFYDTFPTEEELKTDIKDYMREQVKKLNEGILSYYEEEQFKKMEKCLK